MPAVYAAEMARLGLAALTFDHRGYGRSQGSPRDFESPAMKAEDFVQSVNFLQTRPEIEPGRIGGLGECTSAGYLAVAATRNAGLKSLATVAAWLHDPEMGRLVYSGEEGVQARIKAGTEARSRFERTGEVLYVPAVSTTDKNAAMFGPFDYYLNPTRGAVKTWANRFAVMAWPEWLNFNPLDAAPKIGIPVMVIHSNQAALPQGAQKFFNLLAGPKTIHWLDGQHFDFYDQPSHVREAARLAAVHF